MQPSTAERLGQVEVPTLVVLGEHDLPDFHVVAERLAAEIPQSQLVLLPNTGHMCNIEASELFTQAILNFLQPQP